ncbi:hypothetical protein [Streptomyces sp. NPDC008240]|uniref:hypothetical protein n=1 Tax=Streptomyces sp. NPDC008240 TaxID=3364822 RepID=UPI0036E9E76A
MGQNTEAAASSLMPETAVHFGTAQSLVILGFLTAAVALRLAAPHTAVQDIVVLLGASGGIAVGVLLAVSALGGSGRRLLRNLLRAALTSGSAS